MAKKFEEEGFADDVERVDILPRGGFERERLATEHV